MGQKQPKSEGSAAKGQESVAEVEAVLAGLTANFKNTAVDFEEFAAYFDSNIVFLQKLHAFACLFSHAATPGTADLDSLRMVCKLRVYTVQLLMLEPDRFTLAALKPYDLHPAELFVAIFLGLKDPNTIKTTTFSRTTAAQIMAAVVELIGREESGQELLKSLSLMFEGRPVQTNLGEGDISGANFLSTFRDNFEHGRYALREAYRTLCTRAEIPLPLYDMKSAKIMNQSVLAMLRMSNNKFTGVKSLQCLYNSSQSGSSFNRLAYSLLGYNAPTVLLIKHTYKTVEGTTQKGVIGAYVGEAWKDEMGYWGDNTTYIFTLKPRVKFAYGYKGEGVAHYVYMNTKKIANSKYPAGLGFGGNEYKDFRIWLDDDLIASSYVRSGDKTFPFCNLSEGYEETLKIDSVEAWGLGGEESLAQQESFRDMRQQMIQNSRKIDKKKLIEGEFAQQALSRTFGHRDQIEGDVDEMKRESEAGHK